MRSRQTRYKKVLSMAELLVIGGEPAGVAVAPAGRAV
jgi:hypothetical protein